jgi:hypothetical protein
MTSDWSFEQRARVRSPESETVREHRARLAEEERKKAQQRELELFEEHSDVNSPEMRIQAWERRHQLQMPLDSSHPVLDVIAVATRLTLDQVCEAQRARSTRRTSRAT